MTLPLSSKTHEEAQKFIELLENNEGEFVLCSKCGGIGYDDCKYVCNKCWGDGILDWVENITGKPCPYSSSPNSVSGSSSSSFRSSSVSTPTAFETEFEKYIEGLKRRSNEHYNKFRSRTIQRFRKMSDKFKRSMQRCRHR